MHYPLTIPSPDLLVALTTIDGTFRSQAFTAEIRDISDDQKALGRPLKLEASSDGPKIEGLFIEGEDNRLGKEPVDTVAFTARRIPTGTLPFESVVIKQSDLAISGRLGLKSASVLEGRSNFAFTNASVALEGVKGDVGDIVSDVLAGINAFKVDTKIGGTLGAPTVDVTSNLDRQISAGIEKAMGKELDRYKGELQTLLSAKTSGRLEELGSLSEGIPDINGLIGDQDTMLSDLSKQATGQQGVKNILPF